MPESPFTTNLFIFTVRSSPIADPVPMLNALPLLTIRDLSASEVVPRITEGVCITLEVRTLTVRLFKTIDVVAFEI
ncbi:MAG: hypothetical protein DDT22_01260 [candidate division WS2 bacterium]|nr:hypothetical protein [Candidatus Lithacetigena glycinireducens]